VGRGDDDVLRAGVQEHLDGLGDGAAGVDHVVDQDAGAPPDVAVICRLLNQSDGLKVALDIPTGLNCDTGEADADTFRADLTYTFAAYKPAHLGGNGKTYCGEIVCLDIGID